MIKRKQKRFTTDAARKNFGYRIPKYLADIENQKQKEKRSEINFISYEPGPSFHGLNTHLDDSDFLVVPENKNKISM